MCPAGTLGSVQAKDSRTKVLSECVLTGQAHSAIKARPLAKFNLHGALSQSHAQGKHDGRLYIQCQLMRNAHLQRLGSVACTHAHTNTCVGVHCMLSCMCAAPVSPWHSQMTNSTHHDTRGENTPTINSTQTDRPQRPYGPPCHVQHHTTHQSYYKSFRLE